RTHRLAKVIPEWIGEEYLGSHTHATLTCDPDHSLCPAYDRFGDRGRA
ncbi:unnamed protein product, partial [marine sediment metagenome]